MPHGRLSRRAPGRVPRTEAWPLIGDFVAARLAARRAIVETIAAQADVNLPLAGTAVFLAIALVLSQVALHAVIPVLGGCGHGRTLARARGRWKVPLVTNCSRLPIQPFGRSVEATAERVLG